MSPITCGLSKAGDWIVSHRGLVATVVASVGCLVPAVGWIACAGLQAAAFAVRTDQKVQGDGGFQANSASILTGGLLTTLTVGLSGSLNAIKYAAPLNTIIRETEPATGLLSKLTSGRALSPVLSDSWKAMSSGEQNVINGLSFGFGRVLQVYKYCFTVEPVRCYHD